MNNSEDLIKAIGESVFIHYSEMPDDHPWTVGLTNTPMIHEHWEHLMDGLEWLHENKANFSDWREKIEAEEKFLNDNPRLPKETYQEYAKRLKQIRATA